MRIKGIVKRWDDKKFWGLVYCPGGVKYFLHGSNLEPGNIIVLGCRVEFEVGTARQPFELAPALKVVVIGDPEGVR